MAPDSPADRSRPPVPRESPAVTQRKAQLRGRMMAERENLSDTERTAQDARRSTLLFDALADRGASIVACYLSRETEPDTLELVERLHRAGVRVLVPMLGPRRDGTPLSGPDWAWYEGPHRLRQGLWGIAEPDADGLGAGALADAEVVLCSALAVDKHGHRLGVGGGWFDRALRYASIDAERWALLFAHELVDEVPHAPHDAIIDRLTLGDDLIEARPLD